MIWEKIGLVFNAVDVFDWMQSHSALPFAVWQGGDLFKIYFSTRDKKNRSHCAFIVINIFEPFKILEVSKTPVLSPGSDDCFDDCGVNVTSYCSENGLFYYLGWKLPKNVLFQNRIGVARIENGNGLVKLKRSPVLTDCSEEPYSFGYPFIKKIRDKYWMWYDTNFDWPVDDPYNYRFHLRSAQSDDGINWKKNYVNVLELKQNERSLSRPCVIDDNGIFKMWYSINNNGKYQMGYAESQDGIKWERLDHLVGISVSETGWDSDEVEYPYVFDHKNERFMLYNGNGYGRTGFGLARLVK